MSAEPQLKQQLKQLKYKHVDLAIRDVLPILNAYKSLVIGKEQSVLPMTPGSKDYVTVHGTIPVLYRGTSYNIPICLFLLETHPYNPPVVFVRPTPDMVIAESRHVDRQGRVYLPYLAEWKHPASDLSGLVQVMAMIFADNMPVYSRPGGAPVPAAQPSPQMPYQWPGQPQSAGPPQPPQQTPYPNAQPFYPSQPQQQQMYPLVNNAQNTPGGHNLPYPAGPTPAVPPPIPAWSQQQPMMNQTQISQDLIKDSLISAVEDKLKRKFRDDFDQLTNELVSLKQTNAELQSGRKQIQSILQNVETEKRDIVTRTQAIEDRRKEVEAALARLRSTKMPPIDEIVTAPFPLFRQLIDVHAEDLAIDDAIYHLGEALGRNRISLEVYLKKVRELSARQFMMRAIVDKCRLVAGLPAVSSSGSAH